MPLLVDGLSELGQQLRRLAESTAEGSQQYETAVTEVLEAGAEPMLEQMKKNASSDPKIRTGNLYKSIRMGKVKRRARASGDTISIGVHAAQARAYAPHAHLVEFGHGGPAPAPPHPFVRPAFDAKADEAYAKMRQKLGEIIDQNI